MTLVELIPKLPVALLCVLCDVTWVGMVGEECWCCGEPCWKRAWP